jgi:hypothetical protein
LKRIRLLYVLLFLVVPLSVKAQEDSTLIHKNKVWINSSMQALYHNGYIFPTNDFLRGTNFEAARINAFRTFSLKFSTQTTGDKLWQQLYKYPNWGFGVSVIDFYNPEEIGVPVAVYGFFNAPFKRWNKLTFNYEIEFGATFNWKSFNPVTNKYNIATGAGESFMIDAGLNLEYNLTDRIEFVSGFNITHFSNGALKKPNFGVNTVAPKIGLKYNFYNHPIFRKQEVPTYSPKNEWLVSAFGGAKNVIFDSVNVDIMEKYEGVYFPVFGVSTGYNRQISYMSKIGLGMTISYDGSVNAQIAIEENDLEMVNGPLRDKIQFSIYPSYELVVNKVSLILQPAFYLYRKKIKNQSPVFHQRIGLKYNISDNLFVGITLRDYAFHVSDFIEWNLGFRIKRH